jgi:hypothetical protein
VAVYRITGHEVKFIARILGVHVTLTAVLGILTAAFGGYSVYRLWDDQRARVSFRMTLVDKYPAVEIFNLGKTPVLVEAAELLDCSSDVKTDCGVGRQLNAGGEPLRWFLPIQIVDAIPVSADFEARIRYSTPNGKVDQTDPRTFNLTGMHRSFTLQDGFHYVRDTKCPVCGETFVMDATGLNSEKDVADRRREFESGIAKKCPDHDPVFELRQQRKDLEAKRITSDI